MDREPIIDYINNEDLYVEFFTPLFRYLFFRTKSYEIANDLTQTSFLKFLTKNDKKYDKKYAVRLLFTIARNTLIDYFRVEGKKKFEAIEYIKEIQSDDLNPEEKATLNEDITFIRKLIEDLDDLEREIVMMRLSGDVDYKTIASILNISVVSARQIYSRAIKKVETTLKSSNYISI